MKKKLDILGPNNRGYAQPIRLYTAQINGQFKEYFWMLVFRRI